MSFMQAALLALYSCMLHNTHQRVEVAHSSRDCGVWGSGQDPDLYSLPPASLTTSTPACVCVCVHACVCGGGGGGRGGGGGWVCVCVWGGGGVDEVMVWCGGVGKVVLIQV